VNRFFGRLTKSGGGEDGKRWGVWHLRTLKERGGSPHFYHCASAALMSILLFDP